MMRIFLILIFISPFFAKAQKNPFFESEIIGINTKYDSIWDSSRETIVFTGSSSIRMWHNLTELFPEEQIVNTGFGGSQAIDLLGYTDELILKYKPKKVFIYQGDNDISSKKKPKEIISTFEEIIAQIKKQNDKIKVVIISAKPSVARYHLRSKYKRLNKKLQLLCNKDEQLTFANVWDIMFENKKIKSNLFLNDGLHMNANGYQLWHSVIKNHIK
jgi:lysophospholipase L1-like esterase